MIWKNWSIDKNSLLEQEGASGSVKNGVVSSLINCSDAFNSKYLRCYPNSIPERVKYLYDIQKQSLDPCSSDGGKLF